jgi:hypothetical protein
MIFTYEVSCTCTLKIDVEVDDCPQYLTVNEWLSDADDLAEILAAREVKEWCVDADFDEFAICRRS